jgi:acetyl esterase/lipase
MTMIKKRVAVLPLVLLFITRGMATQNKGAPRDVISDITYKKVENGELKLDIYMPKPAGKTKAPVVIFIHGGGWATGDKSEIHYDYRDSFRKALLARGYAVVSINYRLTNRENIHFPAPVIDCKDAVRWLYKNAASYRLDAENIGVWGTSAGAHMAMLLAYSEDKDFHGDAELMSYSSKINYVLNNYGPVDLKDLFKPKVNDFILWLFKVFSKQKYDLRQSGLTTFSGMDIKNQKDEVINFTELYSPINYIGAQTVPTFIVHGDHDKTVPLRQARILDKALRKNNVPHEMIICRGEGHGLKTLNKNQIDGLTAQALAFTDRYTTK